MRFFYSCFSKTLVFLFLILTVTNSLKAQTTLIKGDIAFTGYFGNGVAPSLNDQFSFVLLTNITNNTVINFTDNGWLRTSPTTGSFRTGEGTVTYTNTTGGTLNAGTEILITITSTTTATATLVGGASAGTATGATMPSLSANGDQVIAYQGTTAAPTFVCAIHMNVYSVAVVPPFLAGGDPVTTTTTDWDGSFNGANASGLPGLTGSNFLTNGVDAIWIPGSLVAEKDNARFNCTGPLGTAAQVRTAIYNVANWQTNDDDPSVGPPSLTLPTGCSYITALPAPAFTLQPLPSTICAGSNTSFTVTATNALSYQWQVDNGGGFTNITDDATYAGATTTTLTITAAPFSLNGYLYRCVATNATASTNSNSAALTVTALPVNPTLLAKIPATATVADGTPVSATFTAGSGGTGCADDYRYTTDGGATYLPYTPGNNISTTGIAAGSGFVFIEGRRANCTSLCQSSYQVLASWNVTPLPAGPTTLNAGDIAFSGYFGFGASATTDEFSFVLLRNIGPGTVINFTNNGWLSTNVFRAGEETVTWTSPATALPAGTEIKIVGTTVTRSGGGAAGSVTGTPLSLSANGDQILAYRGTVAAPTFISAIHMNVYSVANGDPTTTSAAAWDGAANTSNASSLPTGLTTGTNCIWIGTSGSIASEFDNARFGTCTLSAVAGSVAALRTALNTQTNWIRSNGDPAGFTLPTGCNYLSALAPAINVTGTPLTAFTSCTGTASAEQNFTASGSALTANIIITAPTGFEISTTSGSGFASTLTLIQSGGSVPNTTIYVRMAASATGTPSGNIALTSTGATSVDVAVSGTVNPIPPTPTITAGGPTTFCTGGSVVLTSSSATGNLWSTGATTQSITVTTGGTYTVTVTNAGCTSAPSAGTTVIVNPIPPTPTITAGGPTTFCTGGSVVLTSSSATGNLWSTSETTQSITVSTAGTYTVTVTVSGCTSAPSAGTTVTVDALPTTADAGPDATACISPGTFTMAANVPSVGTGTWTQLPGGPSTAIIFTPGSATSNIGGLTTAGVYTFRWTISNGTCTPSFDEMTITVNPNPTPFILAGGGTFCPGTTTLTGPVDPNYTYVWERSLSGIANPNSFTAFGGTTSTQAVTSSGNYRLRVTNQFGCSTTDTASVSLADYVFNGSLAVGDATQTGRMNRFAAVSTCAAPKAYPGNFTTTGARFYDAYTITNPRNVPVCATIGIASGCGVNMFSVAYSGSFNPASVSTNYLADPGSSFPNAGYYEATIPANGTIVVVVHEVNTGAGCANYQLTVDVPRDLSVITASPASVPFNSTSTLTAPAAGSYLWSPGGGTTQSITTAPITATTKYYATLGYGNAGCTRLDSVTVNLSCTTPTITCPANSSFNNTPGTCGRVVTYTTTSGGTPIPTLTYAFTGATTASGSGDGSGSTFNVGVTNVTVTATNICGSTSCSFTVTIIDNQAPTVTVGSIASTYTSVAAAEAAALAATSATDNCPGLLTEVASTVGTCNAVITVTTTDVAGNATAVTYNTIIDNIPPTITCPANITVNNGAGICGAVVTYTAPVGTDNCAPPTTIQTAGLASGATFPVGVTTNTFTVTDAAGNTATCSFTVTVVDITAPVINCPAPITVSNDPNQCNAVVTYSLPTVTDNCAIPAQFPLALLTHGGGAVTVSGNTNPGGFFFNLRNNSSNPLTIASLAVRFGSAAFGVIPSPAPVSVYYTTSASTYVGNEGNPGAWTTVGTNIPVTVAGANSEFSPFVLPGGGFVLNPGQTRGIYIFGNAASLLYNGGASSSFTPINNGALTLTPGQSGGALFTVSGFTPRIPNVQINPLVQTAGLPSGSVFPIGVTTNTFRISDASGNTSTCSFTVTVNDTQAPTITCPAPVTVSCASAVPPANIASVTGVTDNCPGVVVTHVGDVISAQTCANRYTITRTYRATDAAGNVTQCTQIITVNDQTPPTMTCPAPVTVSCAANVPAPNIATVTGVSDNCAGTITVTFRGDVISNQTCANRYTITRTYRATDVCGNFTECTQIITVNDQTPPTMTCPAPVTVSCAANVPVPNIAAVTGVSDNCNAGTGFVTVTHRGDVISNQTCANRYTITRTYRATDVCGNFTECTQIITVNDQTPPVMTCPAPVTVSCASAVPVPNIATVTGVSDNCAGVVTVTHVGDVISNQTCANRYTITRTYRATDVCGNFTECTQIITVNDQTPPVMTCPAPVTVSCASAVPVPNIAAVTGVSDNCAGAVTVTHISDVISNQTCANRYTITRTYRATDVCGNFTECTQIITVNDQTAPVITSCPANVTVTAIGACTAVVNYAAATATDNCAGAVTITYSKASGTVFTLGATVVTVTATDVCGNTTTCTFTVTVLDGQIPTVTTPANRVVCAGTNAVFTATATNALSFQWQTFTGGNWVNIAGATTNTLTLNNVTNSMNGSTYRLNAIGLCTTTSSSAATLTVNPLPTITLTSSIPPFLVPGRILTLSAIPSPGGGSFVWLKNNGVIPNENGATLSPITIDGLGSYRVRYTDLNGCVSVSDELVVGPDKTDRLFIYPNPNNGKFQVRFYEDRPQVVNIKVYDEGGKIVLQLKTFTTGPYTQIPVDLGSVPRGMYFVEVLKTNGERVGSKQVIVNIF